MTPGEEKEVFIEGEENAHILNLLETVSTIVDIYLDRPAVIPEIAAA